MEQSYTYAGGSGSYTTNANTNAGGSASYTNNNFQSYTNANYQQAPVTQGLALTLTDTQTQLTTYSTMRMCVAYRPG